MHECDRHTDTHTETDTAWRHRPRLHSIARQKLDSGRENVRNLLKSPIQQWRKKWKSDPESTCKTGSTSLVTHFYRFTPCPCLQCLVDICFRFRELSCWTNDRQTDRQNEWSHYSISLEGITRKKMKNDRPVVPAIERCGPAAELWCSSWVTVDHPRSLRVYCSPKGCSQDVCLVSLLTYSN